MSEPVLDGHHGKNGYTHCGNQNCCEGPQGSRQGAPIKRRTGELKGAWNNAYCWKEISLLKTERDRLRGALDFIQGYIDEDIDEIGTMIHTIKIIANEALHPKQGKCEKHED